jgi:hypothetical protein
MEQLSERITLLATVKIRALNAFHNPGRLAGSKLLSMSERTI